ncbi:MAG TPA: hypothetical protein VKN35_13240, partial [Xanthomonadales bacterium]|nr:hypothetical protein [Xanthomonadales bacterium]
MINLTENLHESVPQVASCRARTLLMQFLWCFSLLLILLLSSPATAGTVAERTLNDGQLILQEVPDIPSQLVARMQQYQNVRSAGFIAWTEKGKGMYVLTRFDRLNQVHRLDFPGGARHQLTFFEEPISEASRQEEGTLLALTMDSKGTERSQIFLFDPKTAATQMVTDGKSRNSRLVWNRTGTQLAYQSTRRNGRSNDIWLMDVSHPESAAPVLEASDNHWWGPVDFSADGRFLLVQQYLG